MEKPIIIRNPSSEELALALLRKAWELKKAVALIAVMGTMSACAGFGVKMEGYRIDSIEHSQHTYKQPLKCLFTECRQVESESTGEK